MRTRVAQRLTANQWTSLVVTGTESGQGKTLTAINLAVALSQDPSTYVFLVDLDLQRPQIGNYMGLQFERGLGDYLIGECPIEEIIYSPGIERLAVVPNSRSIEHSSDFLSSAAMSTFHDTLMNENPQRIVIYDMPPLLLSDDVITFAPRVDGVVLVATEGLTVRGSLERSKELLAEMNVIGVVLNRSAERNDSAYY
ncbi:MAG: CpsD/CapB family tyrosine-protein kinase [Pseudomonadota bacterium]|nr:CpsD/CapB family tyrosine-protein kinase [Pseudomonadota bacterium]